MKLSTFLFLLGCALVIIFAVTHSAHAQPVITNISVAPFVESGVTPPSSTAADIAKVLQDFGIQVNVTSIGSILFLIYALAKLLRNKTALGNGSIGNFLSSIVNLEAKGDTAPQPQPQPAAEPANKP